MKEEGGSFHSRGNGSGNGSWVQKISELPSNEGGGSSNEEPQDADYLYVPPLSNDLARLILARFPISEYWTLRFVNKSYLSLTRSGELYKIRQQNRITEPTIFMLASGESHWWAFDRQFKTCKQLPFLTWDPCFATADKESLCAGTHLLVSGREMEGVVIWRYELLTNRWEKSLPMNSPRCLFASANCGSVACVAGGIKMASDMEFLMGSGMGAGMEVLNSAEKYNPERKSWVLLPEMHRRRRLCSGFYMDNRFYVIGGKDEHGYDLTSGEFYDLDRNSWELIPDMLEETPVPTSRSPPLIAVVNNQLYSLEASSNRLKVYLKMSNSWKDLGEVPVTADESRGWGVAFKSLGDELLVIGRIKNSSLGNRMAIFTCCPDLNAGTLEWTFLENRCSKMSHFVLNCCVMQA